MTREKLDNLARIGGLQPQAQSLQEFDGLKASGVARLDDARREDLSLESRFDLAYNAAHALALAALRWHGFRSEGRYLVFQCLQHTVELSSAQWRVLDEAHRKRKLSEHEGYLEVDLKLVEATIRVADWIRERLEKLEPPTK